MTSRTPTFDLDGLRAQITGRVSGPGDDSWDRDRMPWNVAVDQRPELVVVPGTVDDVIATVNFARTNGLRVATQGTGHGGVTAGDTPSGAADRPFCHAAAAR